MAQRQRTPNQTISFEMPFLLLWNVLWPSRLLFYFSNLLSIHHKWFYFSTPALTSAARRSFAKSQRSQQSLNQRNSSVNELEELKLSRRKSLRSSDSKSTEIIATSEEKAEAASDALTESVVPLGSRRASLENVEVLKLVHTPVVRPVDKTHLRVLRQGSSPFKQATSSKGFGRNNRIRRRSDLKKCINESESPPPKRQKCANEHDTQLRLLKSLNLRNANKDFRHRCVIS